jgi:hypothetical protein
MVPDSEFAEVTHTDYFLEKLLFFGQYVILPLDDMLLLILQIDKCLFHQGKLFKLFIDFQLVVLYIIDCHDSFLSLCHLFNPSFHISHILDHVPDQLLTHHQFYFLNCGHDHLCTTQLILLFIVSDTLPLQSDSCGLNDWFIQLNEGVEVVHVEC